MQFVNIHRHGVAEETEFGIENIYKNFEPGPATFFSAGLHPWFVKEDTWEAEFRQLENISTSPALAAIGECGLDKVCSTSLSLQEKVFAAHIGLANEISKPLIIHCVRAYDEVTAMLKKQQNKVPVVFHGFNKNKVLAQQLTNKGYYLSFGKDLEKEHVQEALRSVPLSSVFLETDTEGNSINSIYELAADALTSENELLNLQFVKNLQTVFNITV